MPLEEHPPLILFSGLAANAKVFAPQKLAFPNLIVPEWPIPTRQETLDSYCQRIAADLRQQYDKPILGGASFGGIVALHVARYLEPRAVVLIGSIRSPQELPRYARWSRPLRPMLQIMPVRLMQLCSLPLSTKMARSIFPIVSGLARQFRSSDPAVFRWSLMRLLEWCEAPPLDCPVFQLHGDCDFVLPARYTSPDQLIRGGGHVISLTHAEETNAFIRQVIAEITGA